MSHGERAEKIAHCSKEYWGVGRRGHRGGIVTWIPHKLTVWFSRARRRREDRKILKEQP